MVIYLRKLLTFQILVLLLVPSFLSVNLSVALAVETAAEPKVEKATIIKVTDGDTVWVNINGKEDKVRFLLIDTPETVHHILKEQLFGKVASDYTKSILTKGKEIEIEYDGPLRDKYNRLLGYVWVDGVNFNQVLLEKGLARVAYAFDPPYKLYDEFMKVEANAKGNKIGIWSLPGFVTKAGFKGTVEEKKQELKSKTIQEETLEQCLKSGNLQQSPKCYRYLSELLFENEKLQKVKKKLGKSR